MCVNGLEPSQSSGREPTSDDAVSGHVKDPGQRTVDLSVYNPTKDIELEVIVVDDASSDGSGEMVRSRLGGHRYHCPVARNVSDSEEQQPRVVDAIMEVLG